MKDNEYMSIHEQVKKLLEMAKFYLTKEEMEELNHLFNHDELGLVLESASGIIVDRNLTVSKDLRDLLKQLFISMDGDSDERWKEIDLWKHINSIDVENLP